MGCDVWGRMGGVGNRIGHHLGIKYWTYGKSGGATFRERLKECFFVCVDMPFRRSQSRGKGLR